MEEAFRIMDTERGRHGHQMAELFYFADPR
jgi:hypothetical protein